MAVDKIKPDDKADSKAKGDEAAAGKQPVQDPVVAEEQRDEARAERATRQENNTNNADSDQSNIASDTKGTVAGDLNAGEGNDAAGPGGNTKTAEHLTAGVRETTEGPNQPHLEEGDIERVFDEESGATLGLVEGQDDEAVADRMREEVDGLMASQGERVLRTGSGEVAYAEPGTRAAAMQGIQQDASGHFESATHVKSDRSGTRV
jgi:hypothetical protein